MGKSKISAAVQHPIKRCTLCWILTHSVCYALVNLAHSEQTYAPVGCSGRRGPAFQFSPNGPNPKEMKSKRWVAEKPQHNTLLADIFYRDDQKTQGALLCWSENPKSSIAQLKHTYIRHAQTIYLPHPAATLQPMLQIPRCSDGNKDLANHHSANNVFLFQISQVMNGIFSLSSSLQDFQVRKGEL